MIREKVMIAEYELGLLYRDRKIETVLTPGEHKYRTKGARLEVYDLRDMPVRDARLKLAYQLEPAVVAEQVAVAERGDTEVGLVYANGKLVGLVAPGEVAFYGERLAKIEIRTLDAAKDIDLDGALIGALDRVETGGLVKNVTVPAEHVGLLYVDGVLDRELTAGRYAYLKAVRQVEVVTLDLRLQTLEVTGQELLTRDRIGIRANVTAVYRMGDAARVATATADVADYLYKELQLALREVIGTRTLEEVLGDKQGINAAMTERVVPQLEAIGLQVATVGVKDIILPGDVRELMNRVIDAEKTAQANVIKRREETAATRALLNTAKLMEDNPILLRLKEVEALEKVAEKVGTVTVANGMEGLLTDLVRLTPARRED
jgi:regulator of protease activity HflC (stomatin/prohibitin superfamily)